ncbi:MAG: NAD+ synthase [Candidatus Hodarchaeales archaeon]|jgi:NAD+ synthase
MNKIPPIDASHTIKLVEDFIKIRVSEAGAKGVVVGLSGGIDSAVVVSIAVRALDPKKVFVLFLPCDTTPNSDIQDVQSLCSQLSVELTIINIQKLINIYSEEIQEKEDPLLLEWMNFKPRVRQSILYFFANRLNYLTCGAGNKSELMIGYFTKFGDGAVDILPIGDVYKTNVFQLGKYLNVPENILSKAPSAGLWEGQTDEAEIGMSYLKLDSILYGLERFQTESEVADYLQIPVAEVKEVRTKLYQSEHKRRGPLIFKLGIRTPNTDWRIPLIKPSDV